MRRRFVLTMTAANRVGILAAATNAIADVGGNLVEVRQTVLQGFFTLIIAADFPADRKPALVLDHVESASRRFGVLVTLKDPAAETVSTVPLDGTESWLLSLEGNDEPGSLRSLARFLAGHGVDVIDLHAARSPGIGAFRATMRLSIPPVVEPETFRPEVEAFGERLGLAVSLVPEDVADSGELLGLPGRESASKPR